VERNRAKRKLKNGEIVTCVAGLDTPDKIDFIGPLGFDATWIECEHGDVSWHQIANMTRACDLWGMSAILRSNGNEDWLITRYFDQGVNGIVVPHVNTREDATRVVQAAKFAPLGHRGIFGGRQAYGRSDYFQKANDETIVIVLIEEKRAVDNLDELLKVDNIDVYHVAPGDLAQTMGYLGQPAHPEVQKVVDFAIKKIAKAGKCAGATTMGDNARHYVDLGAKFMFVSSQGWLAAGARNFLKQVQG
jgi:4-hydroxy-2-oxoheptanedioate aldolase